MCSEMCVCVGILSFFLLFATQAEGYRNRKGYFSLNVQTISSANLRVMNIVARWPGATHDQTVFTQSLIRDRFHAGEFGQYILVGDSGYANTFYLATPYTANNNQIAHNAHMRAYQAAIIRTRNVVERQYGVLKRRFPALAYGLRVNVRIAQKLITVAAMLHNICIERNEIEAPRDHIVEDILGPNGEEEEEEIIVRGGGDEHAAIRRLNARDEIIQNFRGRPNVNRE